MKRNSGFTLIELVVVIVILGILAAVAAPKFMDLQKDARVSALQGLAGNIKSAINLTYSKSVLKGDEGLASSYVCANNTQECIKDGTGVERINMVYGKPAYDNLDAALNIEATKVTRDNLNNITTDWAFYLVATQKAVYFMQQHMAASNFESIGTDSKQCAVKYVEASSKDKLPEVTVLDGGC